MRLISSNIQAMRLTRPPNLINIRIRMHSPRHLRVRLTNRRVPRTRSTTNLPRRRARKYNRSRVIQLELMPELSAYMVSIPRVIRRLFSTHRPFKSTRFHRVTFNRLTRTMFRLFGHNPTGLMFSHMPRRKNSVTRRFQIITNKVRMRIRRTFTVVSNSIRVRCTRAFYFCSIVPYLELVSMDQQGHGCTIGFA